MAAVYGFPPQKQIQKLFIGLKKKFINIFIIYKKCLLRDEIVYWVKSSDVILSVKIVYWVKKKKL